MTSKERCAAAAPNADQTIDQGFAHYTAAEHDRWDRLFARPWAGLQNRACQTFLDAAARLCPSEGGIPDMAELSSRLAPLTGWRVVPVADPVFAPLRAVDAFAALTVDDGCIEAAFLAGLRPTALGLAFALAQAFTVLALAAAQYLGLGRPSRTAPA